MNKYPTLEDFYAVSGMDASMFSDREIEIVNDLLNKINHAQLLTAAYFLVDMFATNSKSRRLRIHSNRLLHEVAAAGNAEYQGLLAGFILDGVIRPPKGETVAKAAHYWLQKAYQQGSYEAALGLSHFYSQNRKGYSRDEAKVELYKKEAERLKAENKA